MKKLSKRLLFKATCAVLILLFFGQISIFYYFRCSQDDGDIKSFPLRRTVSCEERVTQYTARITKLEKQIQKLEDRSTIQNSIIQKLGKRSQDLTLLVNAFKRSERATFTQQVPTNSYNDVVEDFSKGEVLYSEYEVNQFNSYTYNGIYHFQSDLTHGPAVRPMFRSPIGKEYHETVNFAIRQINEEVGNTNTVTTSFDLLDGITRIDRLKGAQYDLYFRTDQLNIYHRVRALRPYNPLQLVGNLETIDTNHDIINLILPLSGRIDKFKLFMENFVVTAIKWDLRVYLTIVYFGQEGRIELENIVSNISKSENYTNYEIIYSDKAFSRGLGLQKGALAWKKGNVLLFFCDVDIFFTPDFLERCRFYTSPGHQVYYPVVFSLYNPAVVYGGNVPPTQQQFKISHDNGYWRDFGYGMVCHYRSDFLQTGGFDLSIKGWGKEDVKLYRKYLTSKLKVIRSVDRGIFHLYHPKYCSRELTEVQYVACLKSKVKSEASHTQLGLLAFGNHIFENDNPNWIEQLQASANKDKTTSSITTTRTSITNITNKSTSTLESAEYRADKIDQKQHNP